MPNKATQKRLQLPFWTECVGTYGGVFRDQNLICVKLGGFVIQFDSGSRQAAAVQEALEEVRIGSSIGLLRTDSPESPLRVRIVTSKVATSVDRSCFMTAVVTVVVGRRGSEPQQAENS